MANPWFALLYFWKQVLIEDNKIDAPDPVENITNAGPLKNVKRLGEAIDLPSTSKCLKAQTDEGFVKL